jgi:hypothetical protein
MTTGRGTTIGLCLLCALFVSAFAAQAASAVSQTAVECTESGTPVNSDRFADAHCKTLGVGGAFFHAAIPANTSIPIEATNTTTGGASEPAVLKANVAGVAFSIEFTEFTLNGGTLENKEAGGEMYAEGLATAIHLANAAMTSPSPSCVVSGVPPGGGPNTPGTILTQPVRATTKGQAQGVVRFEPQTPNKLAEFTITGGALCPAAVQGSYPIFGTVTSSKAEGATIPFLHNTVTATKSLRLKNATEGPVAGLASKITIKKASGEVPIALT